MARMPLRLYRAGMPNTPHQHAPRGKVAPAPRPHRQPVSSTSPAFRWAKGGAVAVAVLTMLAPLWLPDMASLDPEAPAVVDSGVSEEPSALVDASVDWSIGSLAIPQRPFAWQKTKCDSKRREVQINGGCYKEQAGKPPCAEGEFEHDGKCWSAIHKASPPATSLEE
jgi:hypothetical protein